MKKSKKIIILVLICVIVLFIPLIKHPENKILKEISFNNTVFDGYEYHGVNYTTFDFNDFENINYDINYNKNLYSFDLISTHFNNIYDKKFSSVSSLLFGKKFYIADDKIILKYNGIISKLGFPGNFCYLRKDFSLPVFEEDSIAKIEIATFTHIIPTFRNLEGNHTNAVKWIRNHENSNKKIAEIIDRDEISKFVNEIKSNGSVDEFCNNLIRDQQLKNSFYFKVYFKDENVPFYLSIYSNQNSLEDNNGGRIISELPE